MSVIISHAIAIKVSYVRAPITVFACAANANALALGAAPRAVVVPRMTRATRQTWWTRKFVPATEVVFVDSVNAIRPIMLGILESTARNVP